MAIPTTFPIQELRIRWTGLFDYDGLYMLIAEWFKKRRYWFTEGSYKHKVPNALGAEQEIDFSGEKLINNYIKYTINLSLHLWEMTEVEVEKNGIKKKLTNGRMEIKIFGVMELDYEGVFKGTFWEKVRHFFYRYVMFPDITGYYGDQIYYRMVKLQSAIKQHLDMQAKGNEYANYMGDSQG